jgi:hypothetical protein
MNFGKYVIAQSYSQEPVKDYHTNQNVKEQINLFSD